MRNISKYESYIHIIAIQHPLPCHPLSVYISLCWKFFESEYESLQLISTTHIPARCSSRKKTCIGCINSRLYGNMDRLYFFSPIKSSLHWQYNQHYYNFTLGQSFKLYFHSYNYIRKCTISSSLRDFSLKIDCSIILISSKTKHLIKCMHIFNNIYYIRYECT